jgi:hypothetical protein
VPRLGLRARSARDGNRVAATQESREGFIFGDDVDVIRRDARIPRPRLFRQDAAHQRRQRSRDRDIRQGDRLGRVTKQKSPIVRSQTRIERFERRLDVRSRALVAENVRADARVEGVARVLHPRVNRRRARRVSRGRVQGSRGRAGDGDCVFAFFVASRAHGSSFFVRVFRKRRERCEESASDEKSRESRARDFAPFF